MPLPGNLALAQLRDTDPAAWTQTVRAALEGAGSIGPAAAALGVGVSSLRRWIAQSPALAEGLDLAGPGNPWTCTGFAAKTAKPARERHSLPRTPRP